MSIDALIDRENRRCTHEWAAFTARHAQNYAHMTAAAQAEADALAERQGARLAAIFATEKH